MKFYEEVELKDGSKCIFRNGELEDGAAFMEYYIETHGETDYLGTYPDEADHDPSSYAERLQKTKESNTNLELCAFVDGKLVGSCGFVMIGNRDKMRHRAELGITVVKAYWGKGIGENLMRRCIACAKKAGFLQMELDVVADNERAVGLYEKLGFREFGRNPRGFKNREGKWQELLLMSLNLEEMEETQE